MSFNLEKFVSNPSTDEFKKLRKDDLIKVAQHYDISIRSSMKKQEVKDIILVSLVSQGILPQQEQSLSVEDTTDGTTLDPLALKELELKYVN